MTATVSMFSGEPMTRREILIARSAIAKASNHLARFEVVSQDFVREALRSLSDRQFPLPKVTRTRVVSDPNGVGSWGAKPWRNGKLSIYYVSSDGRWEETFPAHVATAERVAVWADLIANPTEEVPDDGGLGV